jgi:hypothetical protein
MLRSPSSRRTLESSAVFVGMAVSFGSLDACSSRDPTPSASGTGSSPATAAGDIPAPAMDDLGERAESSNDLGRNTASAVPWQVSDALPSSCVGNAEFVPLAVVPESFSTQSWRAVDSKSRYLYWSDELSNGAGVHTRLFRWSHEQGITLVGEYSDTYLLLLSADGNAVVGSRSVEGTVQDAFRWTQLGGAQPLDFVPFRLNEGGDVIVGAGKDGLLRWSESAGVQIVDAGATLLRIGGLGVTKALDVIAGSELDGRVFRWTEAGGSVDLGALGGPALVRDISASGDAIFGLVYHEQDVIRPFRWTAADGIRELDAPANTPDGASVVPAHMSADGRVIVGELRSADPSYSYPFRWTEADGMQELLPREEAAYATFLSQSGDVVLGYFPDSTGRGFRWTEATGLQEIDSPVWPGVAADGDLLVGTNAQGPFVRTFGKLAGTQPEIVRMATPELVPVSWSRPRLEGISDDGRLIFGKAVNPDGQQQGWLLHSNQRCTDL